MTTQTTTTRLLLATVAGALVFLAAGVGGAAAAPAASQTPTNKCWLDVINDWADNNQVDKIYAIPCYTQAIQHLNLYPDVRQYSNATDDIQRALLAAIRQDRGNGPGAGAGPTNGGGGGGSGIGGGGTKGGGGGTGGSGGIIGSLSPTNAQSVPLPLLVLGILALLLLAAAGTTWLARRLQARKVAPQPAHAPAVPKRR